MTIASLAERAGIGESQLLASVEGDFELSEAQVNQIADELAVPVPALFTNQELPLSNVPDFRRKTPRPSLFEAGVIKAPWVRREDIAITSILLIWI